MWVTICSGVEPLSPGIKVSVKWKFRLAPAKGSRGNLPMKTVLRGFVPHIVESTENVVKRDLPNKIQIAKIEKR